MRMFTGAMAPAEPLERVRNVAERRVQLGANALQCADRRNGDERRDQTVFDGRRALVVLDQLQKLEHVPLPDGRRQLRL